MMRGLRILFYMVVLLLGIFVSPAAAQGTTHGLTAEYFQGKTFNGAKVVRVDPQLDGTEAPPAGMATANGFSARWSGHYLAPRTETVYFYAWEGEYDSNGYVSTYVNGNLVAYGELQDPYQELYVPVSFVAGQSYDVVVTVSYDVYGGPDDYTSPVGLTSEQLNGSNQGIVPSATLTPAVVPTFPTPQAPWAEASRPLDTVETGGDGPSSADSTDLATGEQSHAPGADIVGNNPIGPDASYQRTYRTGRAFASLGNVEALCPGLSAGWFDNYWVRIEQGAWDFDLQTAYAKVTLTHPNGSEEVFTPVLNNGVPNGAFQHQRGTPYVLTGVPNVSAGTWTSLTLSRKGGIRWTFQAQASVDPSLLWLTTISDAAGNSITINRSPGGKLTSVTNSAGVVLLSLAYDSSGYLATITNQEGRQVKYTFSNALGPNCLTGVSQVVASGTSNPPLQWQYGYTLFSRVPYLTSVAAPDASNPGAIASHPIAYDANTGKANLTTDANGNKRSYNYGTGSTVATVLNPDGTEAIHWTQRFNGDQKTGFTDAKGNSTSISYGDAGNASLPTYSSNRNNQSATFTYDDYGNVLTFTDPRGIVTTYRYDYSTRPTGLVTSIQMTGKTATTFEYYPNGFIYRVWSPVPGTSGTGATVKSREYTYTAKGNVLTVQLPGPTAGTFVTYAYNYTQDGTYLADEKLGLPLTVTNPLGKVHHYRYDGPRLAEDIDEVGNTSDFHYNKSNQLVAIDHPATNQTGTLRGYTEYVYDRDGGTLIAVREWDESHRLAYTQNVIRGKEAEGKGISGNLEAVSVGLDGAYRSVQIKNGNNQPTNLGYDVAGNPTSKQYPLGDGASVSVDNEGNVSQRIDGRNRTTTYTLATDDSRPLAASYASDPTRNATFQYDQYSRLTQVTDHTGTVTYSYDDLDNVMSVGTTFTGLTGTYTVSYTYNQDGSRASMTTPMGTYNYTYNNDGTLLRLHAPWPGVATSADWQYYDNGWLKQQRELQFQTDFAYTGRGFLTDIKTYARNTPTTIRSWFSGMHYDAVGNLLSAQISIPSVGSAGTPSGSLTIQYDGLLRPSRETRLFTGGSTAYDFLFTTDAAGNPTLAHGFSQPVNADSQINASGYVYDGEGNPTTYSGSGFSWDNENRALSVAGLLTQDFRVTGERVWKDNAVGKRTYYLYDGDVVICEIAGARHGADNLTPGAVYGAYCYGPWGLTSRWSGVTGDYTSFSWDPFGNPVQRQRHLVTDPADTCLYDSHGTVLADKSTSSGATLPVVDPIGGLGQWGDFTDEELKRDGTYSGLLLLPGGAYYDPVAGRYVQRVGDDDNEYRSGDRGTSLFQMVGAVDILHNGNGLDFIAGLGDGLAYNPIIGESSTGFARRNLGQLLGIGDANEVVDQKTHQYFWGGIASDVLSFLVPGGGEAGAIAKEGAGLAKEGAGLAKASESIAADAGRGVEQYALRAKEAGSYPVMKRGFRGPVEYQWLEKGEVWKFGETAHPSTRYTQSFLDSIGEHGVEYFPEFIGTRAQAVKVQNMKILNYKYQRGYLPFGNKIVR